MQVKIGHIAAAVPVIPMPASIPQSLAEAMGWPDRWPSASPLERLVTARLFGRSRDRTAIAAAWDEARAQGLTMRQLIDLLPDSPLRTAAGAKLEYINRHAE